MFKETILSGLDCGVLLSRKEYDEIISSFEKWRDERRISISSQTKTYTGNILEEITEYERAKNELEKIDALCDMAVFHINSSTNLRYENYCESAYTYEDEVPGCKTSELLNTISITIANKDIENNQFYKDNDFLYILFSVMFNMGYNPYKCMIETFKEISSRKQDPVQAEEWKVKVSGKWMKDKNQDPATIYKADYESCKIGSKDEFIKNFYKVQLGY